MLLLHFASFLPVLFGRAAALVRPKAVPGAPRRHAPLQGTLVRMR